MAVSRAFKVPNMIAQDVAIIAAFVDPPELVAKLQENGELMEGPKYKNIVSRYFIEGDNDILSSGSESEDEVEAQIAPTSASDDREKSKATVDDVVKAEALDAEDLDSDSSSSDSSSSGSSFHPRGKTGKQKFSPAVGIDLDEVVPPPATYVPSAHEVLATAIPVPALPDPFTLPQDELEQVGEIATVLADSVIVRGSSVAGTRRLNAPYRKEAVLDEGSLLLFDDRTPLGYVWETFGPTSLPHYLVRIKHGQPAQDTTAASHAVPNDSELIHDQMVSSNGNTTEIDVKSAHALDPTSISSATDHPDPSKLFVSRRVYHIPSLSNFVFPSTLTQLKGSDASNIHDEEPADHELEFSDDEAEATHKRRCKSLPLKAPSPQFGLLDGNETDEIGNDAASLYGVSPYDFEDVASQNQGGYGVPSTEDGIADAASQPSSLLNFEDTEIREALMLARNSRNRRARSASNSETLPIAGPSRHHEFTNPSNSRGRGRRRGKDRGRSDRGWGGGFGDHARGRGGSFGQSAAPVHRDQGHSAEFNQRIFSHEEYDPHMPRPPSPTSIAVARATGQWADGTPFLYGSGTAGVTARPGVSGFPTHMSRPYGQEYNQPQSPYDPTSNFSQLPGHQQMLLPPYGVAPHINPRFAQTYGFSNLAETTSGVPSPPFSSNPVDPSISHGQSQLPASESTSQPGE